MNAEGTPARCDLVVDHGVVLTVDASDRVLVDGAVAVDGGRIVAVDSSEAVRRDWLPDARIDAGGAILLPGLVNCHTHIAMTLFRGCADDVDLQGFLARVWERERATVTPDAIRLGATAGMIESLRGGVTTALDMYFHHEVALDAAESLGFRLVSGPGLFDFPAADFPDFDTRLAAAVAWLDDWRPGLGLRTCVCPHSAYTLDPKQLEATRELADAHHALVSVHAAENRAEVADVVARWGGTPIEVLDEVGLLRTGTVLAHAVVLTDAEIARIGAAGAAVAHCPASNLKLASGIARVPELRRAGATVGIGTDGAASSNDLDMWIAMRLTGLLHKARLADPTVLPAREVVRMATADGARALGLEAEIGSLEAGKRADIVVMAADDVAAAPVYDASGTVVYALGRAQVRHVVVEGREVVRDGVVTTADEAQVTANLRRVGTKA